MTLENYIFGILGVLPKLNTDQRSYLVSSIDELEESHFPPAFIWVHSAMYVPFKCLSQALWQE